GCADGSADQDAVIDGSLRPPGDGDGSLRALLRRRDRPALGGQPSRSALAGLDACHLPVQPDRPAGPVPARGPDLVWPPGRPATRRSARRGRPGATGSKPDRGGPRPVADPALAHPALAYPAFLRGERLMIMLSRPWSVCGREGSVGS